MNLTRRSFARLAGVGAAGCSFGAVLSACAQGSPAASSAESSAVVSDTSQVIVALSASSEPEAGFNPIINWGCGEHMHEPLIQSQS